jgi:hypothetical protein
MWLLTFLLAVQLSPEPGQPDLRQPQLASGAGTVGLAYGSGKTIYYVSSRDGGQTFGKPVKVAENAILALGRHRGPRVVITPRAIVISAVVGAKLSQGPHAHGLPADGDLTVWRSLDSGKTWSQAAVVNDVPGAAREGLHAMVAGSDGRLQAAWLDLREGRTTLNGSYSKDGGATWSKNQVLYDSPDGHICQCCHPSLAAGAGSEVYVMWRNVLGGNRDLHFLRSVDGGQTFGKAEKLGRGSWPLNACPMDGGGLVVQGKKVVSVWRRGSEVFLASPGQPEVKLGAGKDPAIAATSRGVFVAWASSEGLQIQLPGQERPQRLAPEGSFVQLLGLPDGTPLATWEHGGSLYVQRISSTALTSQTR